MKKLFALCLAALMVLSLAACGSKSAPAADGKKWIIASDTVFKPFEYTDASGNFVGIDVDILAAVAADQGFDYELQSLGWDAAIAACQAGQADGMIAGASITDERKASGWIFSDGYYNATQSMTVAADSDIAGFDDLSGKDVAVKTGTQGASYAESLKDQYGFNIVY
ncbi:MAG: transporter substrate-binding domain-containing protein, partial [Clostridiales bacterium]|nr:transporter substrate-binding domain-containing protein [Clostridiales bacterium]